MNSRLYLLVSEGPTDILVIKKIAEQISKVEKKKIEIRELSPQKDATTNRYPSHGWEEVRRWCKLYGNSDVKTLSPFEGLVSKQKNWKASIAIANADGLIIQIDTDIVEFIEDLIPSYKGSTKKSRKNFAKKAVLNWLGEVSIPDKIYLLPSTSCTETWLLATHDKQDVVFNDLNNNFDFENLDNVEDRLLLLGYPSYIHHETGKNKLQKNLDLYKNYATKIASNLSQVCLECEEVDALFKKFLV